MQNLKDSNPLVTVYIPTYNRVALLQRAVDSVLSQDYENIELIVVDDNSTDSTHKYLARMAKEDSRFRYFINERNSGACVSRNKAIFAAKGEFITGLDDDDYFLNNRVRVFLEAAYKNSNYIYFTNYLIKNSETNIKKPNFLNKIKIETITHRNLLKKNLIGNQVFIKTDFLHQSGGFDSNLKAWQDLECWYNLMSTYNIKAKMIKVPTQVIDLSHPHERISTKNMDNILNSCSYIMKKYNLSFLDSFFLKSQLIQYSPNEYSKTTKLLYVISTQNLFILKSLLKDIRDSFYKQ